VSGIWVRDQGGVAATIVAVMLELRLTRSSEAYMCQAMARAPYLVIGVREQRVDDILKVS
jgi:hypothetical protein